MKKSIIKLLIIIIVSIFTNKPSYSVYYDWEDLNKTMVALEELFETHNYSKLNIMTTIKMKRNSKALHMLRKYILHYSITTGYVQEECSKEFPIIEGEYKDKILIINFIRKYINKKERYWFINDAYLKDKNRSQILNLPQHGFSSNAIEYNFNDLLKKIGMNKINSYTGLAKYVKFPPSFFQYNQITTNENANVLIKNIVVFYESRVKDIVFLKLKYVKASSNNYRGWLINDFGSMFEYFSSNEKGFIRHAIKNCDWDEYLSKINNKFDLSAKSQYLYINISQINTATDQSIQTNTQTQTGTNIVVSRNILLNKFLTNEIDWNKKTLNLKVDLKNYLLQYNYNNLLTNIVDNRIRIVFNNQKIIDNTNSNHPHFSVNCNGHLLELIPTISSPYRFTQRSRISLIDKKKKPNNIVQLIFKINNF